MFDEDKIIDRVQIMTESCRKKAKEMQPRILHAVRLVLSLRWIVEHVVLAVFQQHRDLVEEVGCQMILEISILTHCVAKKRMMGLSIDRYYTMVLSDWILDNDKSLGLIVPFFP